MSLNYVLQYKAKSKEGIPFEKARLCTVCWTIHMSNECPGCGAMQWHNLVTVLRGLASGIEQGKTESDQQLWPRLRLVSG